MLRTVTTLVLDKPTMAQLAVSSCKATVVMKSETITRLFSLAETTFPQVILTTAAFNQTLWFSIASVITIEERAMYNPCRLCFDPTACRLSFVPTALQPWLPPLQTLDAYYYDLQPTPGHTPSTAATNHSYRVVRSLSEAPVNSHSSSSKASTATPTKELKTKPSPSFSPTISTPLPSHSSFSL
ncbi:hypothetical protein L6452_19972 [Arctium lappa]|uniref:Uncharacterized protein n=1 Tax=Arctium lappa TaxID=4217 RepID=A0ACB9BAL1_ARCLA|nr:hypothetical protein L6452_19972 [Arctium lappa]